VQHPKSWEPPGPELQDHRAEPVVEPKDVRRGAVDQGEVTGLQPGHPFPLLHRPGPSASRVMKKSCAGACRISVGVRVASCGPALMVLRHSGPVRRATADASNPFRKLPAEAYPNLAATVDHIPPLDPPDNFAAGGPADHSDQGPAEAKPR